MQRTIVTKLYTFEGLKRVDATEAAAGDIICLAGIEDIMIGETIADAENPVAIPTIAIDEPTVSMIFGVNTSPFAGRDGKFVTSRQIKDRLDRELIGNVSIRVEPTETPEQMKVVGRGELQLSILIEMMRREGYELQVSRPEIVTQGDQRRAHRSRSRSWSSTSPRSTRAWSSREVGMRRGVMTRMVNHGSGRVRLEFRIPARGLIGFRIAVPDRNARHRHHAPHLRGLGAVARPDSVAADRRARRRPLGRGDRLRDRQPAGARRDVRRARAPRSTKA